MRTHLSGLCRVAAAVFLTALPSDLAFAQGRADTNAASSAEAQERQRVRSVANDRFINGDVKEALDALNEVGEPVVDHVKIEGLVRTKRQIVTDYLDVEPGELFTADRLSRLERRLAELPTAAYSIVRYDPVGGSATVTPIVYERERFPSGLTAWLPVAIRVAFNQEAKFDASDVFGWGEVWTPSVRFDRNWRRAMLRLAVPSPGPLPGLLHFEARTEEQLFEGSSLGSLRNERRTRAGATISDWLTGWLRWEAGPAFDRIDGTNYLNLQSQVTFRGLSDHAAVILSHGRWMSSNDSFTRSEAVITARSSTRLDQASVNGLVGVVTTSAGAPLTIWPEAGAGQGQGIMLRAHRFDRRGLSGQEMFSRRMWFATTEYEHPVMTRFGPIGLAGFVDAVKSESRLDTSDLPLQVDVGAGIRLSPSRSGSRARLDFAYGLRGGGVHITAGYVIPWGTR